ncbi:hypothetical protein SAY87_014909 [Trapa incisa]|uniref:Calmodulin-binding domain-containing protein n=1 Tax=Trapa incisa TaxID=236973 RepID=A0AAN7GWC2_9MYRT|nr:hypothetical protein SAY87_014909 [Trapa incisa]
MASRTKKSGGSTQQTRLRGTSPLDQDKKMPTRPAASAAARRETSPGPGSSRSQIPNHLKSNRISSTQGAKPLKKSSPQNPLNPTANRKNSLDKPPAAAPQMRKSLPSGPRERDPIAKSLLPTYKSALTGKKPTALETNKLVSTPKPAHPRPANVVSRTVKRGSPPNNIVKKEPKLSDLVGVPEVNDDVVVVNDTQDDDLASIKDVDQYEEIEDQADNDAALLHQETSLIEDEEFEKSVADEFKDDDMFEHHEDEDVLVNSENGDSEEQDEEAPAESETLLLDEKIAGIDHHDQEDYNDHEEDPESSDEMGVAEVEEMQNEPENKDDTATEESANGSSNEAQSVKCSNVEVDAKVGEEINGDESNPNVEKEQEEEAISTRQVTVQPDGEVTMTVLNCRKSTRKDSAVSNDVIAETATKLLEQRKNKVKALVGAFETVISLQEPEQ